MSSRELCFPCAFRSGSIGVNTIAEVIERVKLILTRHSTESYGS